jgi:hypothetical protein
MGYTWKCYTCALFSLNNPDHDNVESTEQNSGKETYALTYLPLLYLLAQYGVG